MPTPAEWQDPEYRAHLAEFASPKPAPCRDDLFAPGETPFVCTLSQGHDGDHQAWGESGTLWTQWPRGTGKKNLWLE